YHPHIMKRKPIPASTQILTPTWWKFIIAMGIIMTGLLLTIFAFFGGMTDNPEFIRNAQAIVFAFFVISELVLLLMIRNLYQVRLFSNMWLWVTLIGSICLQAIITFTPLNKFFDIDPLSLNEIAVIAI